MNEAETRAEHIDPALEGGGLGCCGGEPHPSRGDYTRPNHGRREAWRAGGRRLCADVP